MHKKIDRLFLITIIILIIIIANLFAITANNVNAAIVDELRDRITDRNTKIQELEKEINQYQNDLEEVGKEKQTLTSEVKRLDISRQKISTDIKLTQNKIDSTNYQIQKLSLEIDGKKDKIGKNTEVIADTIRVMNEIESESLIEIVLSNDDISGFLNQIETIQQFQSKMRDDVKQLTMLKDDLEDKKTQTEKKKKNLQTIKVICLTKNSYLI